MTRAILTNDIPLVQNASVAAAELIRNAIIEGRLDPGQRLKEEELASELGISRTPVREALLILQTEGLIASTRNRGSVVRTHDEADLIEVYDLRALLEGHAARLAAEHITDTDVPPLEASCKRFSKLDPRSQLRELVRENLAFHTALLDLAGSDLLTKMVQMTIDLPLVYRSYIWYSPEQTQISLHYHEQIVHALAVRDPIRAEMLMKEHVFEARDVLVAHLKELADQE